MKPKGLERSMAIKLRKKGYSYGEIRKQIDVSKSILSYWLKDIPLSDTHKKRLYTKQIEILSRGPNSQKERRDREIKKIIDGAVNEISTPLSEDTYRLFGAALYWAEGTKGAFEITNSDPNLILFMVKWLNKILGINPVKLKAQLNIYDQQNEKTIKLFWSDLCDIPINNFGKSYIKPTNKGYKKNNLYYGTIKIRIPKGTDAKWRVFGWIQKMLKETIPNTDQIFKKWQRLKKVKRIVNLTE